MKLVSWFAPLVIAFVIGYWLGADRAPEPAPLVESPVEGLSRKFQALTDKEIAEYYELKTMEERYKKADEILAKIMNIFVAELGLRMSSRIQNGKNTKIEMPAMHSCPACPQASTSELKTPKPSPMPKKRENKAVRIAPSEKDLEGIRGMERTRNFLDNARVESLSSALSNTSVFANRSGLFDSIRGRFSGMALVTVDNKPRRWLVRLLLEAELVDGQMSGRSEVIMSENGRVFSNKSGSGVIKDWREGDSGSSELYLRVSPSTVFQLYYLKHSDQLIGNVYSGEDPEFAKYIGTVTLRRD